MQQGHILAININALILDLEVPSRMKLENSTLFEELLIIQEEQNVSHLSYICGKLLSEEACLR